MYIFLKGNQEIWFLFILLLKYGLFSPAIVLLARLGNWIDVFMSTILVDFLAARVHIPPAWNVKVQ